MAEPVARRDTRLTEPTMPERDPRCVLVVAEPKAAELIAAWLTHKGVPAEPVSQPPSAVEDPLTHAQTPVPGEFQVWVAKAEQADEAREMLEDQRQGIEALRERESKRAGRTGTVSAECEECGQSSEWPAAEMGTTQDCPHCGKFMDVPDPDDDWGDVDFGEDEADEDATKPSDQDQ
jgi:hypothetical protein